jgi:hypothetical protein
MFVVSTISMFSEAGIVVLLSSDRVPPACGPCWRYAEAISGCGEWASPPVMIDVMIFQCGHEKLG